MPVRFVRDFIVVDRPFAQVAAVLRRENGRWLCPLAAAAHDDAETLWVRVGPGRGGLVSKRFELRLRSLRQAADGLVVATEWEASGARVLFPTMEADLCVNPMGADETHLSLDGRYRVPLGLVGSRLDDLLLHRVVEASIRSFLRRVAGVLAADTADRREGGGGDG